MGGATADGLPFYRFRKKYNTRPGQSERSVAVYRFRDWIGEPLSVRGERPPPLRPEWLRRGDLRPWAEGAAGPTAERENVASHRTATRRGVRVGRRLQFRRRRSARGGERPGPDGARPPPVRRLLTPVQTDRPVTFCEPDPRHPGSGTTDGGGATYCGYLVARVPVVAADESTSHPSPTRQRCLIEPPRLTQRQTERMDRETPEVSTAAAHRDGAVGGGRLPLKVELLNVQSLLPKLPDIRADLHQRQPDVICFTESNLKSSTPNQLVSILGYNMFRRDRVIGRKKSGGGVIVYVNESIQAETVKLGHIHDFESNVESLWLKIKIDNKKAALLCCLYRPPSTNHRQIHADFNYIEDQIQSVITLYPSQRIIIAGDLNADSETNNVAYSRLCELEKLSLKCVVNEPTFYRGDARSVLDVFLLSDTMCTASTFLNCQVETSDYSCHHRRVCLEVMVPRAKAKASYRTARNWRTFDCNAFLTDVANVDWSTANARDASCEELWHAFSSAMLTVLDAHAPMRRFRVHNPHCPPVSDDTMELMKQRRSALLAHDPVYQDLNVRTKRAIRQDCRDSLSQQIKTSHPSALFRKLRPVIAPKRGKATQPVGITANEFNQYFTSVGTETRDSVADECSQSGRSPLKTRLPRVNSGALTITPITIEHLRRIVFALPNKTTPIH